MELGSLFCLGLLCERRWLSSTPKLTTPSVTCPQRKVFTTLGSGFCTDSPSPFENIQNVRNGGDLYGMIVIAQYGHFVQSRYDHDFWFTGKLSMCSNTSVKPKAVGLVSSEKSAKKRRTPKGRSDRAYLKKKKN